MMASSSLDIASMGPVPSAMLSEEDVYMLVNIGVHLEQHVLYKDDDSDEEEDPVHLSSGLDAVSQWLDQALMTFDIDQSTAWSKLADIVYQRSLYGLTPVLSDYCLAVKFLLQIKGPVGYINSFPSVVHPMHEYTVGCLEERLEKYAGEDVIKQYVARPFDGYSGCSIVYGLHFILSNHVNVRVRSGTSQQYFWTTLLDLMNEVITENRRFFYWYHQMEDY